MATDHEAGGWQPIEDLASASGLVVAGCYDDKEEWFCVVERAEFARELMANTALEMAGQLGHGRSYLQWPYTRFLPLPAPPSPIDKEDRNG